MGNRVSKVFEKFGSCKSRAETADRFAAWLAEINCSLAWRGNKEINKGGKKRRQEALELMDSFAAVSAEFQERLALPGRLH